MINNIIISKLTSDGFRIIQRAISEKLDIENILMVETMRFSNKKNDIFEYKYNKDYVFTIYYTYSDNPKIRANLYAIHFFVSQRLVNFEGMIRSLALQFQDFGFHKYNIVTDLLKILNRRENLVFHVGELGLKLNIDWDSKQQGGINEIW